jgi:hypothetical protein
MKRWDDLSSEARFRITLWALAVFVLAGFGVAVFAAYRLLT